MKGDSVDIIIKGLVQGIGFRPFVYRQALLCNINGYVTNTNEYVLIHAEGIPSDICLFIHNIEANKPSAARFFSIEKHEVAFAGFREFSIKDSLDLSNRISEISPDIGICRECRNDLLNPSRRRGYAFINCISCGPRFSIIQSLPYDRSRTAMNEFEMCPACREEYENTGDRWFHAQPIGCHDCGPHYTFITRNDEIRETGSVVSEMARCIRDGKIISVKGLGGYNFICDATNENAVSRLRSLKQREGKPFAVMFRDMQQAETYACISGEEKQLMSSWRNPVVILKQKMQLAFSVNNGLNSIGCLLPYTPLHVLLFEQLNIPVVFTSGNLSDEPILTENEKAGRALFPVSDAMVIHNRTIHNRLDDSVAMYGAGKTRLIRRARGYAPASLTLGLDTEGIFAAGAELVNCFAAGKDNRAILSQHIGDLKNLETYEFYVESIEKYKKLFRFSPSLAACDLHPDYLSSRYARETGLPLEKVQHHHAHIAACMAEYNLDETVIGVCFDGTGLGDDNCIWGGEFMFCDAASYRRYSHLEYIPLPGGDKAVEEPWRTGASYLIHAFGDASVANELFTDEKFLRGIKGVHEMIGSKINSPLTSSAGRLFDAVAAITGVCTHARYHAEAPMRLESLADNTCRDEYGFSIGSTIGIRELIRGAARDALDKIPPAVISARFHNTIISLIFAAAEKMRQESRISNIVLSGGVFQNAYILKGIHERLVKNKFSVYIPSEIPCNDGGIALGQLLVAAKRRSMK